MDREEDREKKPGEVCGEAVEGEEEDVVDGVGMASLGFGRAEVAAGGEEEDDEEVAKGGSGLGVGEGEGLGFGAAGLSLNVGSISEKHQSYTHTTRFEV